MSTALAPAANPALLRADAHGVATLTLNRPAQYNTLSEEMLAALSATLGAIAQDPKVRVVVIASTGPAFSTGHCLKELRARRTGEYYREVLARCSALMQTVVTLPQPVVAKVQGIATAAGCQLVASCDLAIASTAARFATSGIHYGLFCATPGVALARTVARKHALEMLYTGDFLTAASAAEIGLINRAVTADALDAEVDTLARKIAAHSGYAIRLGKASFNAQVDLPLDAAYRAASADLVRNLLAEDGVEGLNAFFEKRRPQFNA